MAQTLVAPVIKHGQAVVVGVCETCEAYTYPAEESCPGDESRFYDDDPEEHPDGYTIGDPCEYHIATVFICGLENHCDEESYYIIEQLIAHQEGDD